MISAIADSGADHAYRAVFGHFRIRSRDQAGHGRRNDYRDAEAIAEAVQRPTMHSGRSLGDRMGTTQGGVLKDDRADSSEDALHRTGMPHRSRVAAQSAPQQRIAISL